jgi:DNA-binding transcriptional LysR family regulator
MNLNYLKYFLVVAETGSFTKASERLFITQPSLSVSIQKLEESLGVKLFKRQKNQRKQTLLTSSGEFLLDKARDILNQFESLKTELNDNGFIYRMLKIGTLHTLPIVHIARLISDFGKALPNTVIEQVSGNIAELQDWLEKSDIDLAITVLPEGKENGRTSQILFQQNYLAAITEEHPLAKRTALSLSDLDGLPYIDRAKCEVRSHLQRALVKNSP